MKFIGGHKGEEKKGLFFQNETKETDDVRHEISDVTVWGGRVMKRCGDSQAFIPLISVIFILLAGMSMTGCATTGTALTEAAYKGQTDVVKDLLDKGADVNERGACGFDPGVTALWCAANAGHMEAVRVLVDRGADVNARSTAGWTPLAAAASMGHPNIARLLAERGADIESAMAIVKKNRNSNGYKLLQGLANRYQQPRYRASQPTVMTDPKTKAIPRAEASAPRPVEAVAAAQAQAAAQPTVMTDPKTKAVPRAEAPAPKLIEAVAAA